MTDTLISKNEPPKPKEDTNRVALQEAKKQAAAEKKAIEDARNELLTPEKVDVTALQTESSVKRDKRMDEVEQEKMAEVMEENKEYTMTSEFTTATSKKTSILERASISQ